MTDMYDRYMRPMLEHEAAQLRVRDAEQEVQRLDDELRLARTRLADARVVLARIEAGGRS